MKRHIYDTAFASVESSVTGAGKRARHEDDCTQINTLRQPSPHAMPVRHPCPSGSVFVVLRKARVELAWVQNPLGIDCRAIRVAGKRKGV